MLSRSKIGRRKRERGSGTREAWLWVARSTAWVEQLGVEEWGVTLVKGSGSLFGILFLTVSEM